MCAIQSDFPYAPSVVYPAVLEDLETFEMTPKFRDMVNFGNAQTLIPRLGKQVAAATKQEE